MTPRPLISLPGKGLRLLAPALMLAFALLAIAFSACNGGPEDGDEKTVLTPVESRYLPVVISSDLAVGPNRLLLGLVNQDDESQVKGADLHLRFFLLEGQETMKSEGDAQAIVVTRSSTHTHEDGTVEKHDAGEVGAYVTDVDFDAPGRWGVEVSGTVHGEDIEPVRPVFSVNERTASPSIGDPAPRSVQPILSDVAGIAEIDTSSPPVPEMHDMTIADAVTSGEPSLIVFATPAFCQSQICGPTKEAVDQLFQAYKGQANFVHVEPYQITRLRSADCPSLYDCRAPVVDEWGLQTEPWVFMVDSEGKIASKFEAVVTYEELEDALKPLLSGP